MRSMLHGLTVIAALIVATDAAWAQPLVATYTGLVFGTGDPFTAIFQYDTADLRPSPLASGFFDAVDGSIQFVTYTDPSRSVIFTTPGSFSEGRYDSTVFDDAGMVVEVNTVYSYTLSTSAGSVFLTFGGVSDAGLITFDSDGLDYAVLEPLSFTVGPAVVATVPLPPSGILLAGSVVLLVLFDRRRRHSGLTFGRRHDHPRIARCRPVGPIRGAGPHAVGENSRATPLMQ